MVGKQWVKSWGMYRWAGEACTYWHGDGKRIEEQLSKGLRDRLESNNKVQYNNTNKIVTSWITLLSPQGNLLIEIKQISWSSLIIFKKMIIPVQYCFKTLLHPKKYSTGYPILIPDPVHAQQCWTWSGFRERWSRCRSGLQKEPTIFTEAGAGHGVGFLNENRTRSWSKSENFCFYRSRIINFIKYNILWTANC